MRKTRDIPLPRCWIYEMDDGWRILAGKTDEDNDLLSLHLARPNDWWFHVHAQPGSHVILQHSDGLEPDKALLETAAAVAAWHSKARNAGMVVVKATKARQVKKPRGAKPGTVTVSREKTIKIRPGLPSGAADEE